MTYLQLMYNDYTKYERTSYSSGSAIHNTSGKVKIVLISCKLYYGDSCFFYTDANSNPTTQVEVLNASLNPDVLSKDIRYIKLASMFAVQPGDYYKYFYTGTLGGVFKWWEWTFGDIG